MAKRKQQSFTNQIRAALADCGATRYRVAQDTGLSEAQLCRFAGGEGLSMQSLDTLAEYLGLTVVVRKSETGKHKR